MPLCQHALAVCLCAAAIARAQQQPAPAPPDAEMNSAIEEFKSETRSLGLRADSPPKAGRRSPLADWHGRVFENFRNDALDAVPHEIRQNGGDKGLLRRNQFGFNVAGPAVLPHLAEGRNTYFSLSYEGVREDIARTSLQTIPTMAQRTGDYSDVVDDAGNVIPIYDPATTLPNPGYDSTQPVSTTNLEYTRTPFPGNIIPPSRMDPVALNALKFYPAPNTDIGPFFRNNYFIDSPETNTANGMIGKLDQSLRERHRVTVELAFSNGTLGAAQWFPTAANPGPSNRDFQTRRGSLGYVFTASGRTVNTLTFEANSSVSASGDTADQTNYAAQIGLTGIAGGGFPVMQLGPYVGMGQAYPFSRNARNVYTWTDGLSTRRGKHTLRVTGQYIRQQVNSFWPQYPAALLSFNEGLTSLPGIVDTGDALATFLMGTPYFAQETIDAQPSYFRRSEASLAFRDRYEAMKGLTINLGLTTHLFRPRTEKYDRQSTVDLNAINPANGLPGALVVAGQDGFGSAFQPTLVRLAPSLGIAWNPPVDTKTVVRANFARDYSGIPIYSGQFGTQGFNQYPTFLSPDAQLQPALTMRTGVPAPPSPTPDLQPDAANNTIADLIDMSDRVPTYQSASLSIEREFPASAIVTIGFAYSGGKNVLVGNGAANPNAIPLEDLQYGNELNILAFNQSLRPYPQYQGFNTYGEYPVGCYQRNAGYVRVEKRSSSGLSVNAYFEFNKQMDDYSGPYGTQDFFNRQDEWSVTAGNRPERLELSYTYELPFGANKPFLRFPDWRRYAIDGWSVSGAGTVASGDPMYLTPLFNNTGGVVQALHVDVVPGVDQHVANQGPALWYNPAAFVQPPDFTIGDVSRTLSSLLNPGWQNFDMSLNKRFALAADRTLEFNATAFDFMNHANWNDPDNVIGSVTTPNLDAGHIIGSRGGRVIQLGLRLSF
ncbi:MAG TPA: hypothetical protein VMQ86_20375 [Bryobacteraceae bacterium]|jgi:hypothetical protein|nr:hypothetical protein [Bryobacteraceae bacterium]